MDEDKNINIKDLANYLVSSWGINNPVLLQKILFLIRYEELSAGKDFGAFKKTDTFQAWISGPVNKKIYYDFKFFFSGQDEDQDFIFDERNIEFVKKVSSYDIWIKKYLKIYENYNVWKLVDLTHENQAWINARVGLSERTPSNNNLNNDEIPHVTEKFNNMMKEIEIKFNEYSQKELTDAESLEYK